MAARFYSFSCLGLANPYRTCHCSHSHHYMVAAKGVWTFLTVLQAGLKLPAGSGFYKDKQENIVRRKAMEKNNVVELVNRDGKLLALFGSILFVGILLIGLIVYISIRFI